MPIVRILVDGYSLLNQWPELIGMHSPFSAAARDGLIHRLTLYRDAIGTPITIVFDGAGPRPDASQVPSTPLLEILYSRAGQTADQIIERVAARMTPYGEVLVVTDDHAERDTVRSLGGSTASCSNFISEVENTLRDMDRRINTYNVRERDRFKKRS